MQTVVDSFGQLDCGQPAQQLSNIFRIVQSPLLLDAILNILLYFIEMCYLSIENPRWMNEFIYEFIVNNSLNVLCRKFRIENGNISQNLMQLKEEVIYFCEERSALKMVNATILSSM
jgi:hypothetical protein